MNKLVQDEPVIAPENVSSSDFFGSITDDLVPGSAPSPRASAPAAAVAEPPPGAPDVSVDDLLPGGTTATPTEKKPEPAKEKAPAKAVEPEEPAGLTPEDLSPPAKEDDAPPDLIKDEEIDTVFKGQDKAKNAIIKERAYNKTLREQLKEASEKLSRTQADAAATEELVKIKAELEKATAKSKQLEDDLGKLDLSRSPTFRSKYDDKINQLGGKMTQTLVSEGVEQADAVNLVRQVLAERRQSTRERLIADTAPGLAGTLAALALEVDGVLQSREAALKEWRATSAAIEETTTRERIAAMTGKVDQVVTKAVDEAVKLGNPYFKTTDNAEWNSGVANRQDKLKGILLAGDFDQIAPLVAEGLTAADLRLRFAALLKQKKEADAQLAEVLKGSPKFGGVQVPGAPPAPKGPVADPGTPLEDVITADLLPPRRR